MFDPSKITDVAQQSQENLQTVFQTMTLLGADKDTIDAVAKQTLDSCSLSCHTFVYGLLPGLLPPNLVGPLTPLIDFIASPLSGVLAGLLGPVLSPGVALINSIEAIANDLGTDPSAALQDLLAMPANIVGSVFNGATLNLDALVPLLNSGTLLPLPEAITFTHLDLGLGGLFSPGVVSNGPWELYDSTGAPIFEVPSVGGSIFNSVGLGIQAGAAPLHADSQPIGPLGALVGMSEIIGLQLGSDWGGKVPGGGFFDKFPAFPPGVGLPPATIPDLPTGDDAGAGAGAAAGLDFGDLVNEFHDFFSDLF